MSARGKSINIFLMDGEANGSIKAKISNWTGVAYKIPRSKLSSFKDRSDLANSGVYFLFGPTYQKYRSAVYIGQAGIRKSGGALLTRLMEHDKNPDKDYWTEAVVFTTTNNSLGQTELSYLENSFCNMAIAADRYEVKNANEPTPGNVTEEIESEMEEFADYAKLVLGVLGYRVFEKVEPMPEALTAPIAELAEVLVPQVVYSDSIPPLPDRTLKIGAYVRTAMRNLSASGYTFTDKQIDEMCTSAWSKAVFNTEKPFMKRHDGGKVNIYGNDGYVRFWSEVFVFGSCSVLVSKEWYDRQYERFDAWYGSLA